MASPLRESGLAGSRTDGQELCICGVNRAEGTFIINVLSQRLGREEHARDGM